MTEFHVVCAWCDLVMEQGPPDAKVSHAICDRCMEHVLTDGVVPSVTRQPKVMAVVIAIYFALLLLWLWSVS